MATTTEETVVTEEQEAEEVSTKATQETKAAKPQMYLPPTAPETDELAEQDEEVEPEAEATEEEQPEIEQPDKANVGKKVEQINYDLHNLQKQVESLPDSMTQAFQQKFDAIQAAIDEKLAKLTAPADDKKGDVSKAQAKPAEPSVNLDDIDIESFLEGIEIPDDEDEILTPKQMRAAIKANTANVVKKLGPALAQQVLQQVMGQIELPKLDDIKQQARVAGQQGAIEYEQQTRAQQQAEKQWKDAFASNYADLNELGVTADEYLTAFRGNLLVDLSKLSDDERTAVLAKAEETAKTTLKMQAQLKKLQSKTPPAAKPAIPSKSTKGTQTVATGASSRRGLSATTSKLRMYVPDSEA